MSGIVLNIRGTNGSGKSTATRALIDGPGMEVLLAGVRCLTDGDICLIGNYPPGKTGGCDRVQTYDLMRAAIRDAVMLYRVVAFESVTVSTVYGSWADFCLEVPFLWLYLDTPLEVCLARVAHRNGGKEFNREKVAEKMRYIEGSRIKAQAAGFYTHIINHEDAINELATFALLG